MNRAAIQHTAAGFVEARKNASPLHSFPGERPTTLAQAYAVQDAALAMWDSPVGGWKVAKIGAPNDALLGSNRLIGPVFRDRVMEQTDALPEMPVFAEGFAAVEAEFILRLNIPDADAAPPTTDEETTLWLSDIRIGIEIASSPYTAVNSEGPLVTICDHGNNFGLVLGPRVPREEWSNLGAIDVTMHIEDEQVGQATCATMLDGPLGSVRFLLQNMASRGITPQSGWWISTGAVTGVHPVSVGQAVEARFAGVGSTHCIISKV